jgi:hypothetical protein
VPSEKSLPECTLETNENILHYPLRLFRIFTHHGKHAVADNGIVHCCKTASST